MGDALSVLLHVSGPKAGCPEIGLLDRAKGFRLERCTAPEKAIEQAGSVLPDLVLIEYDTIGPEATLQLLDRFRRAAFSFPPALFLVVRQLPGPEERERLIEKGVTDFMVPPLAHWEISHKCRVFTKTKSLEQQLIHQQMTLDKTTRYLDNFKAQLKESKEILFEERETLNNALKQVNQMTRERSRLKNEKKSLEQRLASNIDGFCDILYRLIENRVEENRGHGERVSHIAYFIAKQLKISGKQLEDLRKAALLHEVGLLLVGEPFLDQTTRDFHEYGKDLKTAACERGADFFLSCSEFTGCAEIIRYMNENSDGTGRPDGLKKRYIPLLSRILAGADVFDTLKDHQDITDLETFLEKLEKFAGTRLDPAIVAWLEKYAVLHMGSDAYRVKGVGIHQLKPGMTLGTALFTHTGTKLFSVNTLLTPGAIDKIKNYNREYPVDETIYIRA